MHIAHLARAENELFASALEDELRLVFREHVRGAVVLLRQLLLPLHHLAREANDHVVLIGLSVNGNGPKCGAFDLHGLTPILPETLNTPSAACLQPRRCRRSPSKQIPAHPRPRPPILVPARRLRIRAPRQPRRPQRRRPQIRVSLPIPARPRSKLEVRRRAEAVCTTTSRRLRIFRFQTGATERCFVLKGDSLQ